MHDKHGNILPPTSTNYRPGIPAKSEPDPVTFIFPDPAAHIEETAPDAAFKTTTDFAGRSAGGPAALYAKPIKTLLRPSDSSCIARTWPEGQVKRDASLTDASRNYGGNYGTQVFLNTSSQVVIQDGIFQYNSRVKIMDIADGTSNTFLLGERHYQDKYWSACTATPHEYYMRWWTGGTFSYRVPRGPTELDDSRGRADRYVRGEERLRQPGAAQLSEACTGAVPTSPWPTAPCASSANKRLWTLSKPTKPRSGVRSSI